MDTADSQHLSRISKMLLAGTGVAFAWVLLSLALGFSGDQARADADPGLLGAVTSTVEDTASAGTEVVGGTVNTVAETVAPVVAPVSETVAPVAETVAPVAETVTGSPVVAPVVEVVETVAAPVVKSAEPVVDAVTGAAGGGVVAPVVDAALQVVDGVPVVGGIVSGLGVDKAATSVGSTVDGVLTGTTGPVVGAVTDTAGPIVGVVTDIVDTSTGVTPGSAVPGLPSLTDPDALLPVGSTTGTAMSAADAHALQLFLRSLYATYASGSLAAHTVSSEAADAPLAGDAASVVFGAATGGTLALLRSALQADSVLVGPGGAGPGAWVLVALGFAVAYRAWMRRTGLENDVAPPAPAFGTDVSPD